MQEESCFLNCPVNKGGSVQVLADEMPENVEDVRALLVGEVPPFQVWLRFALEYRRQGRLHDFSYILHFLRENEGAIENFVKRNDKDKNRLFRQDLFDEGKLLISNALAAHAMEHAMESNIVDDRNRSIDGLQPTLRKQEAIGKLDGALRYIEDLEKQYPNYVMSLLTKGFNFLCRGHMHTDMKVRVSFYDRAMELFQDVIYHSQDQSIPAHLGRGTVLYHLGRYDHALDAFVKAMRMNPDCHSSVRIGIAMCCFKLGQFDRARVAMRRALLLQPYNVQAIMGEALLILRCEDVSLESPEGVKNMNEMRRLVELANGLSGGNNPIVLNHMSNIYFFRYVTLDDAAAITESDSLKVSGETDGQDLSSGDPVLIDGSHRNAVAMIEKDGEGGLLVRLKEPLPADIQRKGAVKVKFRNLELAYRCAALADNLTLDGAIRAESKFHVGRIAHLRGELTKARQNYRDSHVLRSSFPLPLMGFAQVTLGEYLARPTKDVKLLIEAYEKLELLFRLCPRHAEAMVLQASILSHLPDGVVTDRSKRPMGKADRMAARVRLLEDATSIDSSRRDTWLMLASAYEQSAGRHSDALRAYEKGAALCAGGIASMPTSALNNMAALSLHLGKTEAALDILRTCVSTLELSAESATAQRLLSPHNDFLCDWHELGTISSIADEGCRLNLSPASRQAAVGSVIRMEDFRTVVAEIVDGSVLVVKKRLPDVKGAKVEVQRVKVPFSESNAAYIFLAAQIQEARHLDGAATELYRGLREIAGYRDLCSSRIALIEARRGNAVEGMRMIEEATKDRADGSDDLDLTLGYLALERERWVHAQRAFQEVDRRQKGNPYSLVALGNIYHANLADPGRYGRNLQHAADSYKRVLKVDGANAFAANGLGTTLAEKGGSTEAQSVFDTVRMVATKPLPDASVNAANVLVRAKKYQEAINHYQQANRTHFFGTDEGVVNSMSLAFFLATKHDAACRSAERALHLQPENLNFWYNLVWLREKTAEPRVLREKGRTVEVLRTAIRYFHDTINIGSWLVEATHSQLAKRSAADGEKQHRLPKVQFNPEAVSRRGAHFKNKTIKAAKEWLVYEMEEEAKRTQRKADMLRKDREQAARLESSAQEEKEEAERQETERKAKARAQVQELNQALRERQQQWREEEERKMEAKANAGAIPNSLDPAIGPVEPSGRPSSQPAEAIDWGSDDDEEEDGEDAEVAEGGNGNTRSNAPPASALSQGEGGTEGSEEEDHVFEEGRDAESVGGKRKERAASEHEDHEKALDEAVKGGASKKRRLILDDDDDDDNDNGDNDDRVGDEA